MNIIKPLQLSLLHKSFTYKQKDIFTVSIPIAFKLSNGEILLEQKMWESIGEQLPTEIFDAAMPKHNGEVLVAGDFISPTGEPVEAGSVHLSLASKSKQGDYQTKIDKELAVFGDRHWHKFMGAGISPSSAKEFTHMPIRYDHAYGGEGYQFNPEGKGFKPIETDEGELQLLPNIEYKNKLLTSSSAQVAPASLGRVDIMWQQRLSKAGTYDQYYLDNTMPGFPDDIDWTYFNDAAEDQWLNGFFKGDEKYSITNMNANHALLSGSLPSIYGRAFVNQKTPVEKVNENGDIETVHETQFKEVPTQLDTLWLFPNTDMGVMIYRGTIVAHTDDGTDIEAILLACEGREDTPRSLAHYQDQLTKRLDPDHGYKYMLFSSPLIAEGMRCGFKQIEEDFDFPLEMLGKANMDEFSAIKKAEANVQVEDAKLKIIEQCKDVGVDPTPYIEKIDNPDKAAEQLQLEALLEKMAPGMVTDPENIDVFNMDLSVMDEIKEYIDELKEQKVAEAKADVNLEMEKLKADKDAHLFADAIAQMEQKVAEIDLPPVWPRAEFTEQLTEVKKQISEAEKQFDELRKQGVPEEQIPKIDVDLQKIETELQEAELRLKETYAMGAHLIGEARSPHPEKESLLKLEFLEKLKAGESLVNGDYACIDLSGENLSGADLSGCYLEGVNFTHCDLSNTQLTGAILAGANLTNAKLINAKCVGANIGSANLTDADLTDCDLTKGQLGSSNLTRTNLTRCSMKEMIFIDTDFQETVFDAAIMSQCSFINPVFTGCSFNKTDLSQANIVQGTFVDAKFNEAILDGANFVESTLKSANFTQAQMINSRFVGGCDLSDSTFNNANVSKSCLRENNLTRCDFSNALIDESDFSGAELEKSNFSQSKAFRTLFMKANLKNATLLNFNLMEGSLLKAYLVGADFSGANLYSVNFTDCTLGDNRYKGANLDLTILKDWQP